MLLEFLEFLWFFLGWCAFAVMLVMCAIENTGEPGKLTVDDYKKVLEDHQRLVRKLDIALNGEDGAAEQASLCDIVCQVKAEGIKSKQYKKRKK